MSHTAEVGTRLVKEMKRKVRWNRYWQSILGTRQNLSLSDRIAAKQIKSFITRMPKPATPPRDECDEARKHDLRLWYEIIRFCFAAAPPCTGNMLRLRNWPSQRWSQITFIWGQWEVRVRALNKYYGLLSEWDTLRTNTTLERFQIKFLLAEIDERSYFQACSSLFPK